MSIPRATMRLQFHRGFTFDDAISLVPYCAGLGISHLYASPIATAREGSVHGYDVVDPGAINPEFGGEAALRRLVAALRRAGLGLIVDTVPNHMAVGGKDNPWWLDVLQHGRHSAFARYFDIDWEVDDAALRGKILLPFLGRPYAEALADGEISLGFDAGRRRFEARYFDHVFPIAPGHAADIERLSLAAFDTTAAGRARLHELLEKQHYRLAWWRSANDAINWRRFFDINELAALRVEDEEVFEATHALLLRLFGEGLIDGVRVDHVDGLTDPGTYCRRLRARFEELVSRRPADAPTGPAYIVVEKILGSNEALPAAWGCDGTSGYDFMNDVSRLLHDPRGEEPLGWLWEALSARPAIFEREEEAARREILTRSFAAQRDAAVKALHRLAQSSIATRDITAPALCRTLTEILAHMRVYRIYADVGAASPADLQQMDRAAGAALRTCLRQDRDILRRIAGWLAGAAFAGFDPHLHRRAIRTFQQLSAPLAAKAVEDTAFYRHGKLLSRLDVGFDPAHFAGDAAAFHRQCAGRAAHFPHAMLATATHDHKRGEDLRARLAVLSEIPGEWSSALTGWLTDFAPLRRTVEGASAPSPGDAAMLLQMMVGAWPPDLSVADREGCLEFAERLASWQQKALREAKIATDWIVPNAPYEAAARRFLTGLFDPERVANIASFAQRIAPAGAVNALVQTLLKLTSPGVPDIYQGTEFWDFSLVDPDNRRPVDFVARRRTLGAAVPMTALATAWRDGRIKQALARNVLAIRRAAPELFSAGDYVALDVTGPDADHVVAFARKRGAAIVVVVACRLVARWLQGDAIVVPPSCWGETRVHLPDELAGAPLRDAFSPRSLSIEARGIAASRLLSDLPVAVLFSRAD